MKGGPHLFWFYGHHCKDLYVYVYLVLNTYAYVYRKVYIYISSPVVAKKNMQHIRHFDVPPDSIPPERPKTECFFSSSIFSNGCPKQTVSFKGLSLETCCCHPVFFKGYSNRCFDWFTVSGQTNPPEKAKVERSKAARRESLRSRAGWWQFL